MPRPRAKRRGAAALGSPANPQTAPARSLRLRPQRLRGIIAFMQRLAFLALALGLALGLVACASQVRLLVTPTPSPSPSPVTATPSPAPARRTSPPPALSATPLPSPTPTPRTHIVRKGEDLFGIALRYGISLEALLAANPTVTPQFLSVGTALRIPAAAPTPDPLNPPTPTPIGLTLAAPYCYPSTEGGLWCFTTLTNPQALDVEGITVQVRCLNGDDGSINAQTVAPLLDRLPAGGTLPLAAYFPPPAPQRYQVDAGILSALPVADAAQRYLSLKVEQVRSSVAADGQSALVQGRVSLAEQGDRPAQRVWVLAVALDEEGKVVGLRRWENSAPLAPGAVQTFAVRVYAAGSSIAEVQVLAEARP